MKNSILDINDKLKRFVRSSSYIKGSKNVQEDNEVVSTRIRHIRLTRMNNSKKRFRVNLTAFEPKSIQQRLDWLSGQSVVDENVLRF